jgi:hypothetical protein
MLRIVAARLTRIERQAICCYARAVHGPLFEDVEQVVVVIDIAADAVC